MARLMVLMMANLWVHNFGINSDKLEFVPIYSDYEYNNSAIVVATSPSINTTVNKMVVNYHWFRQDIGKGFVI